MYTRMLPILAMAVLASGTAAAQSADPCPRLAADSGLIWNEVDAGSVFLCRAVRSDGSGDAFSLTFTRTPAFKPRNSDKAETSQIGGSDVQWYKSEIAGSTLQAREALIPLADGRSADITIRAADDAGLQRAFAQLSKLTLNP